MTSHEYQTISYHSHLNCLFNSPYRKTRNKTRLHTTYPSWEQTTSDYRSIFVLSILLKQKFRQQWHHMSIRGFHITSNFIVCSTALTRRHEEEEEKTPQGSILLIPCGEYSPVTNGNSTHWANNAKIRSSWNLRSTFVSSMLCKIKQIFHNGHITYTLLILHEGFHWWPMDSPHKWPAMRKELIVQFQDCMSTFVSSKLCKIKQMFHNNVITCASRVSFSLACPLFVQQPVQENTKENNKVPRYWFLVRRNHRCLLEYPHKGTAK